MQSVGVRRCGANLDRRPSGVEQVEVEALATHMKEDVFGPHLGEVVASGVTVDVALDPEYVSRYMGWRVVASAVQEAQLMARWRATPEGRGH